MIAQKPHFQIFDKTTYLLLIQQECRHGDESEEVLRNFLGEIQLGKNLRAENRTDQVTHQLHRALRARQHQNQHRKQNQRRGTVRGRQPEQDARDNGKRKNCNPGQKEFIGMPAQHATQVLEKILLTANFLAEQRPPVSDKIVPNMCLARCDAGIPVNPGSSLSG